MSQPLGTAWSPARLALTCDPPLHLSLRARAVHSDPFCKGFGNRCCARRPQWLEPGQAQCFWRPCRYRKVALWGSQHSILRADGCQCSADADAMLPGRRALLPEASVILVMGGPDSRRTCDVPLIACKGIHDPLALGCMLGVQQHGCVAVRACRRHAGAARLRVVLPAAAGPQQQLKQPLGLLCVL